MEWWQTLLMTGGTCFITLFVTFVFNWVTNGPKRKKAKEEAQRKEQEHRLKELEERMNKRFDEVVQLRAEERRACGQDHQVVLGKLDKIDEDNELTKEGLQAVIKNDLKIRYLKWISIEYAPMDAKDDLERMYQIYHRLGANGVMDSLREQFLALPEAPKKKEKQKSSEDIELEIGNGDF